MALSIFRAHRKTEFWSARTPANLGPGSYVGSQLASARDTAVKFSAKSERAVSSGHVDRGFSLNDSFPGPGTYSQEVKQKDSSSRAGSSSFASRQRRLAPNAPGATVYCYPSSFANPGPGHYGTPERRPTARAPPRRQNSMHAEPTISSIPLPPRKNEPGQPDLGPGSYNPTYERIKNAAKATNFSRSKWSRKLWEPTNRQENPYPPKDNPGPGHYEFDPLPPDGDIQGNSSFLSKVKMAHEEVVPEERRLLGPGTYEVPVHGAVPRGKQPGFGSGQERGETWSHDISLPYTRPERTSVPGVGSYMLDESARHKEEMKKKTLNYEEADPTPPAFLSSEARGCLAEPRQDSKPGPGAYETSSSLKQQNYSLHLESGDGKFLSNEQRFVGLFEPKEGPCPGQYQSAKQTEQAAASQPTFKSKSERFVPMSRENPSVAIVGLQIRPPVGEYNLVRKWTAKENRAKDYHSVSKKLSFETSAERFNRYEPFPGHRASSTPGPGHYRRGHSQNPVAKPVILKAQRFAGHGDYKGKQRTIPEVGPGHYNVDSTFVKKSFNMTIEAAELDKPKPWT